MSRYCEYGCSKEATTQFKNGRWCCSKHHNQCSSIRKTRTGENHPLFGKKHSKETIEKMSQIKKGKIPWNKGRTRIYSKETLRKMSNSSKGQIKFTDELRARWRKAARLSIEDIKNKYPLFSKMEEMRYNPHNTNEIQTHCKNHKCNNSKENGGWFAPTRESFFTRIYRLERDGIDGLYIYCSIECKRECILYGKSDSQLMGTKTKLVYTSLEYQEYRKNVLERENYRCEYCGDMANSVHHIKPQKTEPFFSLDPDYGLACCSGCHFKYGHKDECSTGQLAKMACKGGISW